MVLNSSGEGESSLRKAGGSAEIGEGVVSLGGELLDGLSVDLEGD